MGTTASAGSTVDFEDLASIKEQLIDRQLILQGAFKDELERLRAANAELAERQGIVQTVQAAAKLKAEAEAGLTEALAKAREALARAALKMDAAEAKERDCATRESAVSAREGALTVRENTVADAENRIPVKTREWEQTLQARENALQERERDYAARVKQVGELQKKLEARIAAITAPV